MYCNTFMMLFFLGDNMKIALFGNSKRTGFVADKFLKNDNEVTVFKAGSSLPEFIDADLLVLPIPTLNKDGFINFKDDSKVNPYDLLGRINKNAIVISCNFDDENYNIFDINKREDFAFLNAIPTAEAAIVLAIENLGSTIYKSRCLICGFGRIGKMLSSRLNSLNAFVAVSARNPKDLAYIEALGLVSVNSTELADKFSEYDVVFQTVPYQILTKDLLVKQRKKPLIIELSSACIGTDMKAAENLGFKAIDATSLPEKFMPNTAGTILYDVIIRILDESFVRKEKFNEQN